MMINKWVLVDGVIFILVNVNEPRMNEGAIRIVLVIISVNKINE